MPPSISDIDLFLDELEIIFIERVAALVTPSFEFETQLEQGNRTIMELDSRLRQLNGRITFFRRIWSVLLRARSISSRIPIVRQALDRTISTLRVSSTSRVSESPVQRQERLRRAVVSLSNHTLIECAIREKDRIITDKQRQLLVDPVLQLGRLIHRARFSR